MEPFGIEWVNPANPGVRKEFCGYCGQRVASNEAYWSRNHRGAIWICPHCTGPTVIIGEGEEVILPGPVAGGSVEHLPESVNTLYEEARRCLTVNAFTSSVLASRKLLMNIAVERGADAGKSFAEYVDYLGDAGYVHARISPVGWHRRRRPPRVRSTPRACSRACRGSGGRGARVRA